MIPNPNLQTAIATIALYCKEHKCNNSCDFYNKEKGKCSLRQNWTVPERWLEPGMIFRNRAVQRTDI